MTWPWPAPPDDGAARHLTPGTPIPDVALVSTLGGTIRPAATPGRSVLFFYPWTGRTGFPNPPGWDDIAGAHGSTPEAEGFRDCYQQYRQSGIEVLGISLQPPAEQREVAGRIGLPYALASDEQRELSGAMGLPTFATGGIPYLKRLTLVVENGLITRVVYPVHPPDCHASVLLSELRAQPPG